MNKYATYDALGRRASKRKAAQNASEPSA